MSDPAARRQDDDLPGPLAKVIFSGSIYLVLLRLLIRLLGLISVSVTARILTPDDFGVVGSAALVISLIGVLREAGLGEAIIRTRNLDDEHVHTIWTLRLLVSAGISGILFLISEPVARLMGDLRVAPVLSYLAFVPVIEATASPASAFFLRSFGFRRELAFQVLLKLFSAIAIIVAVVTMRTYWALVVGTMCAAVLRIVLSQLFRPYLPKLTLSRIGEFGGFAAWTTGRNVATFISGSSHDFVVRLMSPTDLFGLYHLARDLSRIFIVEMLAPVRQVFLPAFSALQDSAERFKAAVTNALGAYFVIVVALSLGVSSTADEIVGILLGEKWHEAAPFLTIIALGAASRSAAAINQTIYVALNRQRLAAIVSWVRAVLNVSGCTAAGYLWGPVGVASAFAVVSAVILLYEVRLLLRLSGVSVGLGALLVRPLAAGIAMVAVIAVLPIPAQAPLVVSGLVKAGAGATVYSVVLLGLWFFAGRPSGGESTLLNRAPGRVRRLFLD